MNMHICHTNQFLLENSQNRTLAAENSERPDTKGVASQESSLSLVFCLDTNAASAKVVGVLDTTLGVDLNVSIWLVFLTLGGKCFNFRI